MAGAYHVGKRRRIAEDAERRNASGLLRINWPTHCGVFLHIERWHLIRDTRVKVTWSREPVFVCPACTTIGYRSQFHPAPWLDAIVLIPR